MRLKEALAVRLANGSTVAETSADELVAAWGGIGANSAHWRRKWSQRSRRRNAVGGTPTHIRAPHIPLQARDANAVMATTMKVRGRSSCCLLNPEEGSVGWPGPRIVRGDRYEQRRHLLRLDRWRRVRVAAHCVKQGECIFSRHGAVSGPSPATDPTRLAGDGCRHVCHSAAIQKSAATLHLHRGKAA
jgi:hypothetical protein